MPDFQSAANTLRSEFNSNISGLSPSYTVFYDNQQGSPPNDETWLRFTVRDGQGSHVGFGSGNRWRFPGTAIAQIFVPVGQGDGAARDLADTIAGWFRGKRISDVEFFQPPYVQPVGPDGAWWQINVVIPFQYDLTS